MQQITYVPPGGSYEDPERRVDLALAPPYIIGTLSGTGGSRYCPQPRRASQAFFPAVFT